MGSLSIRSWLNVQEQHYLCVGQSRLQEMVQVNRACWPRVLLHLSWILLHCAVEMDLSVKALLFGSWQADSRAPQARINGKIRKCKSISGPKDSVSLKLVCIAISFSAHSADQALKNWAWKECSTGAFSMNKTCFYATTGFMPQLGLNLFLQVRLLQMSQTWKFVHNFYITM